MSLYLACQHATNRNGEPYRIVVATREQGEQQIALIERQGLCPGPHHIEEEDHAHP